MGLPLQYGAGVKWVDKYVGMVHGFLYIAYLLFALDLARRARFTLLQILGTVAAGWLPFLAFVAERSVRHRVQRKLAAADALATGAPAAQSS